MELPIKQNWSEFASPAFFYCQGDFMKAETYTDLKEKLSAVPK